MDIDEKKLLWLLIYSVKHGDAKTASDILQIYTPPPGGGNLNPLFLATDRGFTEIVKLLLDSGMDTDISGIDGESLLWVASKLGHIEIIKLLLDHGVDIEEYSGYRYDTVLFASIEGGQLEAARYLINRGARINATTYDNESIYEILERYNPENYQAIYDLLKENEK